MPLERLKIAKEVEKEHVQLNKQMSELKSIISGEVKEESYAEWRLHFLWKIRDFKNALLKHFDLEEEGGFMYEVLKAAPHESAKVTLLKNEHNDFISLIDIILDDLKSLTAPEHIKLKKIRECLNSLFAKIDSHENKENQLIQLAYFREYGSSE